MIWNPWRLNLLLNEYRDQFEQDVQTRLDLERRVESWSVQCESERHRRIAAEAIAAERRAECDRLLEQLREARREYADLSNARLKSVDALNLKLMEPRAEERPPDMSKFKDMAVDKLKGQIVSQIRQSERAADAALLAALHPRFAKVEQKVRETAAEPEGVGAV